MTKTITEQELVAKNEAELFDNLQNKYVDGRDYANQLIGKLQMAQGFSKIADVVCLSELIKIKENKLYRALKGVSITLSDGTKIADVGDWVNFCKAIGTSKSKVDEDIRNAKALGLEAFESLKKLGLGTQGFRDFRMLTLEQREETIESAEDIETLKERIEDITFQKNAEKAELEKQLKDAEETVSAVRENSAAKQQELDEVKEREAKRQFSQSPWQHQTKELAQGMLTARVNLEQCINQFNEIFQHITNPDSPLDQKAVQLLGRSMFTEATHINNLVFDFVNEVSGVLGGIFSPDMDAVEVIQVAQADEE